LSLDYNSQGNNGIVGVGWSLSGLLSIGHCPQTFAQDSVRGGINFDSNDRFCLDGQRLVAISGTYGPSFLLFPVRKHHLAMKWKSAQSCPFF
jgi:hypothetical protein